MAPASGVDPRGFHSITLGCKLNQFDTAAIEGELTRRGFHLQTDPARAAVVIINTCTVTDKADAEARKRIRGVKRHNPSCRLLVTGCYAELDPQTIRSIDGVDRVFGNHEKQQVSGILDELAIGRFTGAPAAAGDRGCDGTVDPPALHFGERSRAFLKVQEGCRLRCSYCVIPRVRGDSRSVSPEAVERGLARLLEAGYREVVLTGVNTGDYGRDLSPSLDLAGLLRRLLAAAGPNRIRLNSLEPRTVSPEIIDLLATNPRLAPHLQVPLQSGSDAVLRDMHRNYRVRDYFAVLRRLRNAVPHIGLGADVIVGFPGESDADFEQTYARIAASDLNYLHVFSWSPRPGTPAAGRPDRVRPEVARERSARLRSLAADAGLRFRRRFEQRQLDAVVLAPRPDGRVRALTGNFIEVLLEPGAAIAGNVVSARITGVTCDETAAVVSGVPDWARGSGP